MKPLMNWIRFIVGTWAVSLCWCQVQAQIVFSATDLPHEPGEYYRAYVATNVDLSPLIGAPGGPQRWDFSQPLTTNEGVLRVDVVPPDDQGHGGGLPGATYAERETGETEDLESWYYYSMNPTQGRTFHGFYNPYTEASAEVVFDSPSLDFPDSVPFGQRWQWSTDHQFLVLLFMVDMNTTVSAHADAYGTVVLPGIGEVPALRATEIRTSAFSLSGQPRGSLGEQVNTNYVWLVRGIGRAVKITLYGNNPLAPVEMEITNTVLRVFEASTVKDRALSGVKDLRITLQQGSALLDWSPEINVSGYRVEARPDFTTGAWEPRGEPATNFWSESVTGGEPHMFFRVLLKP